MSRSLNWTNFDGLWIGGGRNTGDNKSPAKVSSTDGKTHTIVIEADVANLQTAAGSVLESDFMRSVRIPANASVPEVRITNCGTTSIATITALTVGTYTISAAGALVAVAATGLVEASVDGLVAGFNVAGETKVLGNGATATVTGKTTVGAAQVVPILLRTGAAGTGNVRVEIDYVLASV